MMEEHDQAIKDFGRVIELEPQHVDAYFRRALSLKISKKFPEAVADFDKAETLNPGNPKIAENFKKLMNSIKSIEDFLPREEVNLEKEEAIVRELSPNFDRKVALANR